RSREPAAGRRHLRRLRGGAAAPRRTRGARRNDAGPGGGPMSATAPAHPHNRAQKELRAFHEEKAIAKAYDGRLLRRLWGYVRPHRAILYVSFAALAIQVVLQLVQPILMGEVVARAAEKDAAALMRTGATLAGLLVLLQLVTFGQMYTMQLAGARAMADLRAHVFDFYQRLSLRYFDRTPVGRLVTRSTNDVDAIGELFSSGVLNALGDLVSLVAIVVLMIALDWRLSLITFATLPIVALLVDFVRR